jgi:hypothetical protein
LPLLLQSLMRNWSLRLLLRELLIRLPLRSVLLVNEERRQLIAASMRWIARWHLLMG